LVNRILDEPVQLSKIAFKHTLMEYYQNNETNEKGLFFVCFVIFRLFRILVFSLYCFIPQSEMKPAD
jgi:hypothetical protein